LLGVVQRFVRFLCGGPFALGVGWRISRRFHLPEGRYER